MRMVFLSMSCIALMAGCGQASNDASPTQTTIVPVAIPASTDTHVPASASTTAAGVAIATNSTSTDSTSDADANEDAPQTSMQLTPLSKDDIALYLQVMHAAADRVQHPTAADTATLARYKALMKAVDSGGKKAPPSAADIAMMEGGTLIEQQMDMLVVRELHIDEKRYNGISSAIEDVVPNPTMGVAGGATGEGVPTDLPKQSAASLALQQKIHAIEAQDTAIIAPYRAEIQQLLPVVRNMHNLH